MGRIGARVRKTFAAIGALEWLLTRMDPDMLLEVMFKFEGLVTVGALEFAQSSRFVMADHVSLQTIDVGEVLMANTARHLSGGGVSQLVPFQFVSLGEGGTALETSVRMPMQLMNSRR